MYTMDQT
jgi:hypothetical protein